MLKFRWLCLLAVALLLFGCGTGDQGFAGGPEPVGALQMKFDFPQAKLPDGVASLEVQVFDANAQLVRDVTSPRVSELTIEALSEGRYLVRTLFFDATGAPLGFSDLLALVTIPGPTVVDVEVLLTGTPPAPVVPSSSNQAVRLAFLLHPANAASGTAQSIQVVALDAGGETATGFNGNVSVSLLEGTGVLSGTTNANAVNGVADLSVLVTGSGSHRLRATGGGLDPADSLAFTLVDQTPVATALQFAQVPTTGTQGQALSTIQVQIVDQFGNRVPGATNVVSLSGLNFTGAGAVSAVDGTATFAGLQPAEAGSFTLTAASSGLASATAPLSIDPLQAATLNFVQVPATARDAQQFAVQVEILDQFGVRLDTTAAVTLSLAAASNVRLGGTLTQNAVNGLATFSDVSLSDAAGTVQLLATSPGAQNATSSDLAVTLWQGRIYLTESNANRVTSFNLGRGAGPLLNGAAAPLTTIAGLNIPIDCFIDVLTDTLFVADTANDRIERYPNATSNNGPAATSFTANGFPRAVSFDSANDRAFVCEQSLASVEIFDNASSNTPTTRAIIQNFNGEPRYSFYDPAADRLFVAEGMNNGTMAPGKIDVFDNVSALSGNVDLATVVDRTIAAGLVEPESVFYEAHTRRLYVGQNDPNSMPVGFEPQVCIYDNADTTNNPPRAALINGFVVGFGGGVRGVAVDWERDELYVADGFNGEVKIFAGASGLTGTANTPAVRALTGRTDVSGISLDLTRD